MNFYDLLKPENFYEHVDNEGRLREFCDAANKYFGEKLDLCRSKVKYDENSKRDAYINTNIANTLFISRGVEKTFDRAKKFKSATFPLLLTQIIAHETKHQKQEEILDTFRGYGHLHVAQDRLVALADHAERLDMENLSDEDWIKFTDRRQNAYTNLPWEIDSRNFEIETFLEIYEQTQNKNVIPLLQKSISNERKHRAGDNNDFYVYKFPEKFRNYKDAFMASAAETLAKELYGEYKYEMYLADKEKYAPEMNVLEGKLIDKLFPAYLKAEKFLERNNLNSIPHQADTSMSI